MQIVFLSNFLTHHQTPISEELYALTAGEYRFVETQPMPGAFKSRGYSDENDLPWLIRAWTDEHARHEAEALCENSDVLIYGGAEHLPIVRRRIKAGKLTFEYGERWLKRGWLNFLSPNLLKTWFHYLTFFRNAPFYRLNASAFAINDLKKMHALRGRSFKWGYFTQVPDMPESATSRVSDKIRIMFVGRLIGWKHPELAVRLGHGLKKNGYRFEINIFGDGVEEANLRAMIKDLGVDDCVHLCGNLANARMLEEMAAHDILLATSDANEGWGAVVNEAMSMECAVVGSDATGSVPYLIQHGKNGMVFRSGDSDSLQYCVEYLIDHPELLRSCQRNARLTMQDVWSPQAAAHQLITLIQSLQSGQSSPVTEGPCSLA